MITHKIPGCVARWASFPACSNSGSFVGAASIWFPVSRRHTPLHVGAQLTAQSTGGQAFALTFSRLGTRVMRLDPAAEPPSHSSEPSEPLVLPPRIRCSARWLSGAAERPWIIAATERNSLQPIADLFTRSPYTQTCRRTGREAHHPQSFAAKPNRQKQVRASRESANIGFNPRLRRLPEVASAAGYFSGVF